MEVVKIKKVERETHKVDFICPNCEKGFMIRVGSIALLSYPPLYPHSCSKCGYEMDLTDIYPIYKEVIKKEKFENSAQIFSIECKTCESTHHFHWGELSMSNDSNLNNNPSIFPSLHLREPILKLDVQERNCECGQQIILFYNYEADLYLMRQISPDKNEIWEKILELKNPNVKIESHWNFDKSQRNAHED